MSKFEKDIVSKLLKRGFSNEKITNNRGLISATIDEVILKTVKKEDQFIFTISNNKLKSILGRNNDN